MHLANQCSGRSSKVYSFEEEEHLCTFSTFENVDLFSTFSRESNNLKKYNADFKVLQTISFESEKHYTSNRYYASYRR